MFLNFYVPQVEEHSSSTEDGPSASENPRKQVLLTPYLAVKATRQYTKSQRPISWGEEIYLPSLIILKCLQPQICCYSLAGVQSTATVLHPSNPVELVNSASYTRCQTEFLHKKLWRVQNRISGPHNQLKFLALLFSTTSPRVLQSAMTRCHPSNTDLAKLVVYRGLLRRLSFSSHEREGAFADSVKREFHTVLGSAQHCRSHPPPQGAIIDEANPSHPENQRCSTLAGW
ncbi:hypothetical protein C8R43DRAFT_959782 [Mycena crocata]|nr:hypothetical protein C8R43DRAFT_959782 [Mycena crocata]